MFKGATILVESLNLESSSAQRLTLGTRCEYLTINFASIKGDT